MGRRRRDECADQTRHPTVDTALELARTWCAGHVIDNAPALGHAIRVALTLDRHIPDAHLELVSAVLLHDSPEFAPADVTLDELLTARLGLAVIRVVRALEAEHVGLDTIPGGPPIPIDDPWVLHASAADKIVALTSMLSCAATAPVPAAFWARRAAFRALVPYFRAFHTAAAPHLPVGLAADLDLIVAQVENTTGPPGVVPGRRGSRQLSRVRSPSVPVPLAARLRATSWPRF